MPRTDTPAALDERTQLLTMLGYVRETAIAKVDGLGDEHAHRAPLASSPLTAPAAILNHLRWVDQWWFEVITAGREDRGPWTDEDPDGEFTIALTTPVADVVSGYRDQIAASDAVLADLDLGAPTAHPVHDFHPNVRWVVLHMIEETARHNGHLDLLREMADGVTGV
ncbi:MAG: DinB family protein [Nocardioidaceae bacterium]